MGESYIPMNAADLLTIDEVSEMFNYSKSSILTKFKQTAQSIKKKYGVDLLKVIKSDGTFYCIQEDKSKSLSLY